MMADEVVGGKVGGGVLIVSSDGVNATYGIVRLWSATGIYLVCQLLLGVGCCLRSTHLCIWF